MLIGIQLNNNSYLWSIFQALETLLRNLCVISSNPHFADEATDA